MYQLHIKYYKYRSYKINSPSTSTAATMHDPIFSIVVVEINKAAS